MNKVTKPIEINSIKGTLALCLSLVYQALKDDIDLESDAFLSNSAYCLGLAGVSIDYLKSLIKKEMKEVEETFNKEAVVKDCTKMSISEVAKKYGKSEASIYGLCNRNHIKFKKSVRSSTDTLLETIKSYDGKLSLAQIAKETHHSWSFIKNFCLQNELTYRAGGQ